MSHTYQRGEYEYQSVTTILNASAEKGNLIDWAARLAAETGDAEAHKKESKTAMGVGSDTHGWIEDFLSERIPTN